MRHTRVYLIQKEWDGEPIDSDPYFKREKKIVLGYNTI